MNQLNWQPSDSGERAEANGFRYSIQPAHPVEEGFYVRIDTSGEYLTWTPDCMIHTYEQGKESCQIHANAITAALSSKASTVDLRKCAEEIMECPESRANHLDVADIIPIIRKHLQPASESAWISDKPTPDDEIHERLYRVTPESSFARNMRLKAWRKIDARKEG